jgi:hypothetical protein
MRNYWQLRDYVFAAFMTIGMILAVFVSGPLAPPGLKLLAWAPLGGIFLTLGMARLQRRGAVVILTSHDPIAAAALQARQIDL